MFARASSEKILAPAQELSSDPSVKRSGRVLRVLFRLVYSPRNAWVGSTEAALKAGKAEAATASNSAPTAAK